MKVAREGWTHACLPLVSGAVCGIVGLRTAMPGWWVAAGCSFAAGAVMLYFFRDPERAAPPAEGLVVAGADGTVTSVQRLAETEHLSCECVRVSTYLGLRDVHINRSPMAGKVRHVSYERGQHLFTRQASSSERNQHSSIVIEGEGVRCLVKQIVGPMVRRVVTVFEPGQVVERGQRLGLMKFGSRLDVYLPAERVEVVVQAGDRVRAGETVIARILGRTVDSRAIKEPG